MRTCKANRVILTLLWLIPAALASGQDYHAEQAAFEDRFREWKEDPERVERYWKTCLSAEDYARAIERTGQSIHAGPRGAPGPWIPAGPIGNYLGRDYNGRIAGIQIYDDSSAYMVYVGACGGGLWKADPFHGIGVWTNIGYALPNPSVRAFAVHPTDPDTIIVGTGDWRRYGGGGLFKTTNEGAIWTDIPLYEPGGARVYPDSFFRIIYHPSDANTVIAACNIGLFVSNDAGENWSRQLSGEATDVVLHPTDPDTQYACVMGADAPTGRGVYYTTDCWDTYALFDDPDLPVGADFDRASIAICRDYPDNLAIVVENGDQLRGAYKSANAGSTWSDITAQELHDIAGDQIWHAQAITFHPTDPDEIYIGAVNIARSTDGGATWVAGGDTGIDIGHPDITQLVISEQTGDNVLWICNDGGVYRHVLGGSTYSWNGEPPTGLRTTQIDFMDAQRGFRTIGLQDNGIVYRANVLADWAYLAGGDGFGVRITDLLADHWWFIDGMYGSEPGTRMNRVTGLPPSWEESGTVASGHWDLFYDRETETMFSTAENTLWSSPAFGTLPGWTAEPVTIGACGENDKDAYGSRLRPETVYVSYWSTAQPPWLTVCRRIEGVWNATDVQLSTHAGEVNTVFASQRNPAESWAGILVKDSDCPRLLHTTDYWQGWGDLTNELSSVGRVQAIAVTPFNQDQIFVGTDLGVFWSQNGGQSWEPFQTGLPVVRVTSLVYVPRETAVGHDTLVAATYGHGLFERPIEGPTLRHVDPGYSGTELGTFEHPYNSFGAGLSDTPDGGLLGLRGDTYYVTTPMTLDSPMTIDAYDGPVVIR